MNLSWSVLDTQQHPFPYAVLDSVLQDASAERVLSWLEEVKFWRLKKTDFYEQYEFSLTDVELPDAVAFLKQQTFQRAVQKEMESLFRTSLAPTISIIAHKLTPSQYIGIHNDCVPNVENYRLTLQLTRTGNESSGGLFMLFNSENVEDVHRILRPINNSALAFAISRDSFHAVSQQTIGTRFTLVFSFHDKI